MSETQEFGTMDRQAHRIRTLEAQHIELARLLDRVRDYLGEVIQCRGNSDICICDEHSLLREIDDFDTKLPPSDPC